MSLPTNRQFNDVILADDINDIAAAANSMADDINDIAAAVNSLADNNTGGAGVTVISTAAFSITAAGEYVAGRSTTITMPGSAQVALSKGQFVIAVEINGSLYVSDVGTLQDGGPTHTSKIQVTPTGPTWVNDTENGGGTWSTPTQTGVTYSPSGTGQTAAGGQTITWTATPAAGYEFPSSALSSWSHTFPASAPTLVVLDNKQQTNAAGAATYTHTGVNLGPAHATRLILIACLHRGANVSAVSIGGVNAEILTGPPSVSPGPRGQLVAAVVPSGTTGDVVITYSAATVLSTIEVFEMVGTGTIPYATKVSSGTNNTLQLPATPAGGVVVGLFWRDIGTGNPAAWVGLTPVTPERVVNYSAGTTSFSVKYAAVKATTSGSEETASVTFYSGNSARSTEHTVASYAPAGAV